MCCGSNNFGYTDTDKKKLERLKEVRAEIKKSLKCVERVETVKATSTKKVISKPVEEVEPSRWTAYITEYGADGSAEDIFKEWFYWWYNRFGNLFFIFKCIIYIYGISNSPSNH